MEYDIILNGIAEYVIGLFDFFGQEHLYYHNEDHTRQVVHYCVEIAAHHQVGHLDMLVVQAAAWFHDTGYLQGLIIGHEEASVNMMRAYFATAGWALNEEIIDEIAGCILATNLQIGPTGLLQQIVCDADIYHLGTAYFSISDVLVKREIESRTGKVFSDWDNLTLAFLERLQFHTAYCREKLAAGYRRTSGL